MVIMTVGLKLTKNIKKHSPLFGSLDQIGELLVVWQGVDDDALGVVELARHEGSQVCVEVELRHQSLC